MIDSFLKYLQFEKRVSVHTLLAYQNDLRQFSSYLTNTFELTTPESADHGMIRSWIIDLVDEKLDPLSVNRKIACLRSFFKYLQRQEVIAKDPMLKIRILKTSKKLPAFVKESDMLETLNSATYENNFDDSRTKLIVELFYGTGMRLSELLHLKENQIDLKNRTLKVLGKRNKERVIPFSKSLVSIIEEYLVMKRKEIESPEHNFLLVTNSGAPCYPTLVYRIVKDFLKNTPTDKKSPHVLRHTYATHLLNKGAEINAVKDLLGHSSLAATQVYTHNSVEKLKKAFDQAHPKA
jgi:integrase/recombinase XerC